MPAGAKRLVPAAWRKWPLFDNIFRLSGVPVITVQLRYDGWITEMQDPDKMRNLSEVSKQHHCQQWHRYTWTACALH
jgi:zeta-carotene desaturase